jgi:hypothetical protein
MKLRVSKTDSNINFSSNVYTVKGPIFIDAFFVGKVSDYSRLKSLKNKYFNYPACTMLTPLQEQIINEGAICTLANNDPCWGIEKFNGEYLWACKCVNIDCASFQNCRPVFNDDEFYTFSPELNDNFKDYTYHSIGAEYEHYNEIINATDFNLNNLYDSTISNIIDDEEHELNTNSINVFEVTELDECGIMQDIAYKDEYELTDGSEEYNEDIDENYIEALFLPSELISSRLVEANEEPENVFSNFEQVEQEEIIQFSYNQNLFVDAGPGTGKTYTLIEKINYLVCKENIDPESIQILSFTNAAVTEIKNRLNGFIKAGGDRGLRNVDVRTFHSMAWWLLGMANELLTDQGWKKIELNPREMDYDKSILLAAELIKKYPDIVSGWNHFIVDEVQDLTGGKAIFVLEIIEACMQKGCGFSIFGDSCQAIYDYVKKDDNNVITSDEFYKMLYKKVYGCGRFARLDKNHRQTDKLINLTKDFRMAILDQIPLLMSDTVKNMHRQINKLDKTALLLEKQDVYKLSDGKSLCFLCRSNGQTLRLSTLLRKRQIQHVLNAYETRENLAPWIAQVFIDYSDKQIRFDKFSEIIAKKNVVIEGYTAKEIWERIKSILHSQSEIVDIDELLEAIRTSRIDDILFRVVPSCNVIVSNIHRSKGREYDRVVLDDSFISGLESTRYTMMAARRLSKKKSLS